MKSILPASFDSVPTSPLPASSIQQQNDSITQQNQTGVVKVSVNDDASKCAEPTHKDDTAKKKVLDEDLLFPSFEEVSIKPIIF